MSSPLLRPGLLALAIAFASAGQPLVAQAESGSSQVAVRSYDIPTGPLGETLARISRESGRTLSADPALISGKRAPAVHGQFTAEQAVQQALAGSGLRLAVTTSGTLSVQPVAEAGVMELGATSVTGLAMGTITEDSGSYTSNQVTIGKGTHSLKEIPQSVSVITRQRMDDQNLNTLAEVLENTTGITTYQSPSGGKYFYSRGFEVETFQYDGIPLDRRYYAIGSSFTSDTLIYDRVEVLRGANGLLQGSGAPSASVNLVRKRPKAEPAVSITASAGSWDTYRQSVDASAPLTADGSLRGRAVIGHEDRDYFYDTAESRKNVLFATLEYDLGENTVIGGGASVEDMHSTPFFGGLPRARSGASLDVSRSTYTGADWNKWDNKQVSYFADVTHDFNEDWRLKAAGTYVRETNDILYSFGRGAVDPATGAGMNSRAYLYDFENISKGGDINLTGKFRNGGREHEVVVGANASELKTDDLQGGLINLGPMNIYDPVSPRKPTREEMLATSYAAYTQATITQTGLYGVLRYKLLDPLTLVVGARSSDYEYEYKMQRVLGGTPLVNKASASGEVSPYAGLIYELTPEWSAYMSYADIFKPQTELGANKAPLEPIIGSSYELGLKGELLDGRLNTSFALFRTDQENKAMFLYGSACDDTDDCYGAGGKARSQGFDAEISGEVLTDLQLFAGYTYTHTENLTNPGDPSLPSQKGRAANSYTPRHMLRLWADYRLPGQLNQFSVGAGGTVQSGNYHDNFVITNGVGAIHQGGYAVWNGRIGYQIDKNFSAAINANNLLDKRYYSSVGWLHASNVFGEPRNYTLTLKADF